MPILYQSKGRFTVPSCSYRIILKMDHELLQQQIIEEITIQDTSHYKVGFAQDKNKVIDYLDSHFTFRNIEEQWKFTYTC